MDSPLVKAENIRMHFPIKGGILQKNIAYLKAVDGISLHINKGETLGLVGETGCGKTTLGRCLLRLFRVTDGRVLFEGDDISKFGSLKMRHMRRYIQMIFEHPSLSLNPAMVVWKSITEPLRVHRLAHGKELRDRADELLRLVELEPYHAERFSSELSGGERQRVEIARALATAPVFLVCDNPLSQLDVSIQSQLTSLFIRLREQYELTYLFIAHDLALIRRISDRIAVMYSGKFMETANCEEFFNYPLHPYSQALLSSVLIPDPKVERERKVLLLPGELPSPIFPPTGCRFHTRCPQVRPAKCSKEEPVLRAVKKDHFVACHFA